MSARSTWLVAAAWGALGIAALAQSLPDIDGLLARVGERVADYYKRAQNLVCTEKSTVQSIGLDFSPIGFARVVESEMRVETDDSDDSSGPAEARVLRELRKVNGRPPRDRDKKDRAGCTDPNPLSPEPLAFLLPANQRDYRFVSAGLGKGKDRNTLQIEFTEVKTNPGKLELLEDPRGHDDCYRWQGSLVIRGRLWIDATTFEVLRVEQRLATQGEMRVSPAQQRKHNFPSSIAIERYDTTIRYKTVAFTDPEEALLLPESIDTVIMVRSPLQSNRTRQVYSDYRRFLTAGRVVK
jgi:hypothetical protein